MKCGVVKGSMRFFFFKRPPEGSFVPAIEFILENNKEA